MKNGSTPIGLTIASSAPSRSASAATLGNVQVSIAGEVALDYIALRSTQARYAIAQSNLETQVETLQITEWRVQKIILRPQSTSSSGRQV